MSLFALVTGGLGQDAPKMVTGGLYSAPQLFTEAQMNEIKARLLTDFAWIYQLKTRMEIL